MKLKHRVEYRVARLIGKFLRRYPRFVNEGEATARATDLAFAGYPMDEDFATKEEAVEKLQELWSVLDDWDGSRINVYRAQYGFDAGYEVWKKKSRAQR